MESTMSILAATAIAILLVSLSSLSASEGFIARFDPELKIRKATGVIRVDGVLNDPGWSGVTILNNFVETGPGDQAKPAVETVACIACGQFRYTFGQDSCAAFPAADCRFDGGKTPEYGNYDENRCLNRRQFFVRLQYVLRF